jgi:hypothetical protein
MGDAFSLGKPGEEASMRWKECSFMEIVSRGVV